jgi:L-asparaginase / beta-aspartyl-peptidase
MARSRNRIALVAHGGAGAIGPAAERPERRRGMMAAIQRGAKILRDDGSALETVIATVAALEDHPLFNAGYGSLLNSEGNVEMDASVMVAEPVSSDGATRGKRSSRTNSNYAEYTVSAGAVAAVSRVRNPIMLARAVMEHSPHILMTGQGAESFARKVGVKLVRPEEMVTERARERWRARMEQASALRAEAAARSAIGHGTVGAVAVDRHGAIAAATSTGGVPGKLYGRVGDSALIGAGTFAHAFGAASATGQGEAIIMTALCREAVLGLEDGSPQAVAREAIDEMIEATGAEAGIIIVDRRGRIGYAHNAASMQVARYDVAGGMRHLWLKPIANGWPSMTPHA